MAIRNRTLSPKIRDIMLAAPDIDFDVFRREIAEIEASDKSPPVTLFVSQDDHALDFSRRIAGNEPRLGAINPNAEPFRTILDKARVQVVDLTKVASNDPTNHGKFAQSEVVRAIGKRLASGQTLTDAKPTLGERFGGVAEGAAATVGQAATMVVSAPAAVIDPATRETLADQAAALGATAAAAAQAPVGAIAP
jgi:esterase/lipase superfamily enzyme